MSTDGNDPLKPDLLDAFTWMDDFDLSSVPGDVQASAEPSEQEQFVQRLRLLDELIPEIEQLAPFEAIEAAAGYKEALRLEGQGKYREGLRLVVGLLENAKSIRDEANRFWHEAKGLAAAIMQLKGSSMAFGDLAEKYEALEAAAKTEGISAAGLSMFCLKIDIESTIEDVKTSSIGPVTEEAASVDAFNFDDLLKQMRTASDESASTKKDDIDLGTSDFDFSIPDWTPDNFDDFEYGEVAPQEKLEEPDPVAELQDAFWDPNQYCIVLEKLAKKQLELAPAAKNFSEALAASPIARSKEEWRKYMEESLPSSDSPFASLLPQAIPVFLEDVGRRALHAIERQLKIASRDPLEFAKALESESVTKWLAPRVDLATRIREAMDTTIPGNYSLAEWQAYQLEAVKWLPEKPIDVRSLASDLMYQTISIKLLERLRAWEAAGRDRCNASYNEVMWACKVHATIDPTGEDMLALQNAWKDVTTRLEVKREQVEVLRKQLDRLGDKVRLAEEVHGGQLKSKYEALAGQLPVDRLMALEKSISDNKIPKGITSGPWGQANFQFDKSGFPEVAFEESGDEVTLRSTACTEIGNYTCEVTPMGEHLVSIQGLLHQYTIELSETQELAVKEVVGKPPAGYVSVYRGVTQATYKELTILELEHLVDFAYAFKITVALVTDKINGLAGMKFGSKVEAMTALTKSIGEKSPLIPRDPMQLPSWRDHLWKVVTELAGFSSERDLKLKHHIPDGYRAVCRNREVILEPRFKKDYAATESLIDLGKIACVFNGKIEERDDSVIKGRPVKITKGVGAAIRLKPNLSETPIEQKYDIGGQNATIVSELEGELLWVEHELESTLVEYLESFKKMKGLKWGYSQVRLDQIEY